MDLKPTIGCLILGIALVQLGGSACSEDAVFVSSLSDKDEAIADLDEPELVQLCTEATGFLLDNGAAQSAARILCTINGQDEASRDGSELVCERTYTQCMLEASFAIAGTSPTQLCSELSGSECRVDVRSFEACVTPFTSELEAVSSGLTCDSEPASVLNAFVTVSERLGDCEALLQDCSGVLGELIDALEQDLQL